MKSQAIQVMLRGALMTGLLGAPLHLSAQEAAERAERKMIIYHAAGAGSAQGMPVPPKAGMAVEDNVVFLGPMGMVGGGNVKGVPYSATVTTEMMQQLADGNRIRHTNTSKTYRDSEGRTRRDQSLPAIGPFAVGGESSSTPPNLSFITDPVAKVSYVLNHTDKTAHKMPAPQWMHGNDALPESGTGKAGAMPPLPPPSASPGVRVFARRMERAPGNPGTAAFALPENVRREELGKKLIEGIEVEGTRTVMTIPAGAIGNERAIEVITEEWHSPLLQVLVSSLHSDPRMGENRYELSNISRNEPDASLFQVPASYTILEGGPATFHLPAPVPAHP